MYNMQNKRRYSTLHTVLQGQSNLRNQRVAKKKRNDTVLTLDEVLKNAELQEIIYKPAKKRNV
jgi:hypothetical protein